MRLSQYVRNMALFARFNLEKLDLVLSRGGCCVCTVCGTGAPRNLDGESTQPTANTATCFAVFPLPHFLLSFSDCAFLFFLSTTPPYVRNLFAADSHATESPLILRPLNTWRLEKINGLKPSRAEQMDDCGLGGRRSSETCRDPPGSGPDCTGAAHALP